MEVIIGFGILVVIVAIVWAIGSYLERKRTNAMQEFAASLNFTFCKRDDDLLSNMAEFHLFSQGHSKKIQNIMNGCANDIDVTIMDYKYTTGSGRNSHTWNQTVILFQSDLLSVPTFTLKPENIFHKIGSAFGFQDIDFDTHPVFSKKYLLRGPDEDAIRRAFDNNILSHYEKCKKGLCTEGDPRRLLIYRSSKKLSTKNIKLFLEEAFQIFSIFKNASV